MNCVFFLKVVLKINLLKIKLLKLLLTFFGQSIFETLQRGFRGINFEIQS